MSQTRRTTSHQGSSRLALSVGKANATPSGATANRHPLKHEWSISYVHRPPGTKVEYEKEIKRVATFGSIESFLHLYSHLTPANELQPVTDILVFLARIPTPGTWECMPDGGKFTIRLQHPITPVLYESLLFALIGDQFDEEDRVVGCVLSARQSEDLISVWIEEEGESLRSGELKAKILSILNLPSNATCEYRSNRALLDAAATMTATGGASQPNQGQGQPGHSHSYQHQQGERDSTSTRDANSNHNRERRDGERSYQSSRSNYSNRDRNRDNGHDNTRDQSGTAEQDNGESRLGEGRSGAYVPPQERGQGRYTRGGGGYGYQNRDRGDRADRRGDGVDDGGEGGAGEGQGQGGGEGQRQAQDGRRFGSRGRGFRDYSDRGDRGEREWVDRGDRGDRAERGDGGAERTRNGWGNGVGRGRDI